MLSKITHHSIRLLVLDYISLWYPNIPLFLTRCKLNSFRPIFLLTKHTVQLASFDVKAFSIHYSKYWNIFNAKIAETLDMQHRFICGWYLGSVSCSESRVFPCTKCFLCSRANAEIFTIMVPLHMLDPPQLSGFWFGKVSNRCTLKRARVCFVFIGKFNGKAIFFVSFLAQVSASWNSEASRRFDISYSGINVCMTENR